MSEKLVLGSRPELDIEKANIQERHPDWPRLDVEFYFSSHGSNIDMQGVTEHISGADVLIYENIGKSVETKDLLSRVSRGEAGDIDDVISNDKYTSAIGKSSLSGHAYEPILRALDGSGVVVGSLDIGMSNREDVELIGELNRNLSKMASHQLSYRSALIMTKNNARDVAIGQARREERMADNFEPEIADILALHPELKDRENLKILITLGSYHTSIGRRFARRGIQSSRYFSGDGEYLYDDRSELQRDFVYGIDPNEEVIKRALSGDILEIATKYRHDEGVSNEQIAIYLRRIVASLSDEQHEKLFGLYSSGRLNIDNINNLVLGINQEKLVNTVSEIEARNTKHSRARKTKLGGGVVAHTTDNI